MIIPQKLSGLMAKISAFSSRFLGSADVALDLGTSMTRIAIYGKGVSLREPTYIGLNTKTNEYLFFGEEAREIYGKAPNFIRVVRPFENGIIADFDANVLLVRHFLEQSVYPFFLNKSFLKSKLTGLAAVPAASTEVEQKAIQESLVKAGLSEAELVEKPLAYAVGAGLPVFSHAPIFVIDMGGGLVEMAVTIMGGIVEHKSTKNAGRHMDKLIINYIHLKYGVIIGEGTAESLKISLLTFSDEQKVITVRGKSLENGLPKSIRVKTGDIREALAGNFNQIIDMAKELIETVPPELIDGIIKNGVVLTGGLALIPGLESLVSNDLKIPAAVADNPQEATINGLMKLLDDKEILKKILIK